jgi:hypothetical protein
MSNFINDSCYLTRPQSCGNKFVKSKVESIYHVCLRSKENAITK